jgi:S1-C subfamily serine protease
MLKKTFVCGAALIISCAAALADPAPITMLSVSEMNTLVNSANFIVTGGGGLCSGTLISTQYRLVLTAHHCVNEAITNVEKEVNEDGEVKKKTVEVFADMDVAQKSYADAKEVGGSHFKAKIIDYDKTHDLALLQILADKIPQSIAVQVYADQNGPVQRGDAVWAMGNPLGLDASMTFGHIASTTRTWKNDLGEDQVYLQTDGMVTFGNSGGALLEGKYLIGVPDAVAPGLNVAIHIPYTMVQALLTKNCYEEVWSDHPKQSFADCDAEKKAKADDKTTTKDLLRQFLKQSEKK